MQARSSEGGGTGDLWVITSYFNPCRYDRRLATYREFRKRLKLPLAAVELAYGPEFDLDAGDADILINLRGSDVMWQKERLLNVAVKALPDACRYVAWVDCDIVFGSEDWADRARRLLQRLAMVQLFERAHFLMRDASPDATGPEALELTRYSVSSAIAAGQPARESLGQVITRDGRNYCRGMAWAAHRDLLEAYGLYDACVIGGGDTAFACAAYGYPEEAARMHHMNPRQQQRYFAWAGPFSDAVAGSTGFAEGDIYHLWHGDTVNRHAGERHRWLAGHGFDPFEDIAVDASGAWRWVTQKPALHACLGGYFALRKEDG